MHSSIPRDSQVASPDPVLLLEAGPIGIDPDGADPVALIQERVEAVESPEQARH